MSACIQLNRLSALFAVLVAALMHVGTPSVAGLVAQYDFNGNVLASSGNGNHGTNNGATLTTDRFGNSNNAYFFDGSDSIATGLLRQTYSEDFSISAWFRFDGNVSDNYRPIIAGEFGPFFLGKETVSTNISMQNGNHVPGLAPGTNAWDGQWHNIVAKFDGTAPNSALTGGVFLDGTLVGSALYNPANTAPGELFIGHEVVSQTVFFLGAIDDVTFYDHALSNSEIAAIQSASVSEPGALIVFGLGVLAFGYIRRRRTT